jgi:uncharacterized protein YgbK (DUF1537 family)
MDKKAKDEFLASLPDEWPDDLLSEIQREVKVSRRKVVVLDDDPTGTQTVHSVPVLTEWPVEALCSELMNDLSVFYLLTNSRSLPLTEAQTMNAEIGGNLVEAGKRAAREFVVVSRSDSTLRGHFPGEVKTLAESLGQDFDAWLIIPFFLEGGRYTINDIHYVAEGEWLVPAGETEFARDAVFGYRASNLRQWVEEKTDGRISAQAVASISIEDIRRGGPKLVTERFADLAPGSVCIINASSYRDMEVFTQGLLAAEASGQRFLYRSAASFVRVRAGLPPRPLLTRTDFELPPSGGGLFIIGSHVPRTTSQINALLTQTAIAGIKISVEALLAAGHRQAEIEHVAQQVDQALQQDRDVVVYTSRRLITGADVQSSLSIGQQVSEGLVAITQAISIQPRYLVAKGGITSSDVATQALGIRRALVLGQIFPGVPVWQLGPESRYPGMPYVVFPGNVGGPQALVEIVKALGRAVEA